MLVRFTFYSEVLIENVFQLLLYSLKDNYFFSIRYFKISERFTCNFTV